ncbi:MAG TPA: S8 family serine peptidase [Anaerolineae bacterium]|nr:S8 family serine peptidase [Anaerolineae bacterium]
MKKLALTFSLLLLGCLLLALPATAGDDPQLHEKLLPKIDPALLRALDGSPDGTATFLVYLGGQADLSPAVGLESRAEQGRWVYDTLRAHAGRSQAGIRAYLDAARRTGQVRAYTPFWIVNGVSVTAGATALWDLAARDEVDHITLERTYTLTVGAGDRAPLPEAVEWNIAKINADTVWATYNVTGTGVLVANIDSGVMGDHTALAGQYAGTGGGTPDHNYHWFDSVNGGLAPYDDNGHGTHTMGTIAGDDGGLNQIGVAPGARWIAVKAFSAGGTGTSTDIHEAFQWVVAPCDSSGANCDPARAPRLVSNSWGSSDGSRTEFLPDVIALRAAGIWPVFSAGNDGPGTGTIGSPASFAQAFAVGATDSGDLIASFSSRGPSPLTAETKPDVSAPGVGVRSAYNDGGYRSLNGTSMASPHAAGAGALLLSAQPTLGPDQLEEMLTTTALDLGEPGPDMIYGHGRLDVLAAMQRLLSSGHLTGVIRDAATSQPIPGATVNVQGMGYSLDYTAGAGGVYSATYLLAGTYTVTAGYYGYEPGVVGGVTVVTASVTVHDLALTALPTHTLSGYVTEAGTGDPLTATVRVLGTPLAPAPTDATGFYSLVVAEGEYDVEAHSFAHATGLQYVVVDQDRTLDFILEPLPPILLVDDDEGDLRDYSPHVQDYFLAALAANDYNYTYWDIEAHGGAPDFDTLRQYAAVVWFGGEFGRIKDITDAAQAQTMMDYLDLGGRLFYTAQEHTFYYGDDAVCDTDPAACPFTYQYLNLGAFVEDRKAETVYGVAGDPVGGGLGPFASHFPPFETDFSDGITPGVGASTAFTASSYLNPDHVMAHTYVSPTAGYKVVFMAYPFEALPAVDAADVLVSVMDWLGVQGAVEGVTLAPAYQSQLVFPGEAAGHLFRVRNLNAAPEIYSLEVLSITLGWPATLMDAGFTTPIVELGPVLPGATADFGLRVEVPDGATPGAAELASVEVRTQSQPVYADRGQAATHARMTYYALDDDECGTGVHLNWVDATSGQRHDIGGTGEPVYFSTPLPAPFTFYNETYDRVYANECGSLIFGDDNIYDDCYPSDPPIPNPTITDPNNAVHATWGTHYWNPHYDPAQAVYTRHVTGGGRNWFVVEWHHWDDLLGGPDTFEIILDLDSSEIYVQYLTVTHPNYAVAGIENAFGTEGVLYVNDGLPAKNALHDRLAVKYGVGQPPEVNEVFVLPWWDERAAEPGTVVTYLLTISNTSSVSDTFTLEAGGAEWPVSFWDVTFTTPVSDTGPMASCTARDVGARVTVPRDAWAYHADRVALGARSQQNTLILGSAPVTTTALAVPGVAWLPTSAAGEAAGPPSLGQEAWYTFAVTNTGNVTDTFVLAAGGAAWETSFVEAGHAPIITHTRPLSPFSSQQVSVLVRPPLWTYAGSRDAAAMHATGQAFSHITASAAVTTTAAAYPAVDWMPEVSSHDDGAGRIVPYLVEVRNRGNVDDIYTFSIHGAAWTTTLWNESFTLPLSQTTLLAPGAVQRIGVRVQIPASASSPDLDAALLRATSTYTPGLWADALLITRVARPVPGEYGVSLSPPGVLNSGTPGTWVPFKFVVTNRGTQADTFDLAFQGASWPLMPVDTLYPLAPGSSATIQAGVWIPAGTAAGDWDAMSILVTSQSDATVRDALAVVTVARTGEAATHFAVYLPLVVRGAP